MNRLVKPSLFKICKVSSHPSLRLCARRLLGNEAASELTTGEKKLIDILKIKFPGATTVHVSDISGGCGAMYQISIIAEEFRGKRTVQQHRMINEALADEIKEMHGLQINTKPPDS